MWEGADAFGEDGDGGLIGLEGADGGQEVGFYEEVAALQVEGEEKRRAVAEFGEWRCGRRGGGGPEGAGEGVVGSLSCGGGSGGGVGDEEGFQEVVEPLPVDVWFCLLEIVDQI